MFFYFAKVLWFLAQPSSLIAAAIALGALLIGTRWRRSGTRLLAAGLVLLFACGLLPVGNLLILPLENRFARPDLEKGTPVTGLIILGGAEDSGHLPPRELAGLNEAAERFTEAVALSRRLPGIRVVFSGGSATLISTQEEDAAAPERLLQALGVSPDRITREGGSRDTYENAVFTTRLLDPKPGERWLLITSGWHMPRAMGCFRKAGFAVEAWPVDFRTSSTMDWQLERAVPEGLRRVDFVVREYIGLVAYYLAGRTSALFPGP